MQRAISTRTAGVMPAAAATATVLAYPQLRGTKTRHWNSSKTSRIGIRIRSTSSRSRNMRARSRVTVAYLENGNKGGDGWGLLKETATKIVGALPLVGLLMRIASDEGGVGGDRVRFPEFCSRIEKRCPADATAAFAEFRERHGRRGSPKFVAFWCWTAAVGAGLLKSDDILLGAASLRASFDLPYEEERFNTLMDQAAAKRLKSKSPMPEIAMEDRAEKALEAICRCCIGADTIESEDATLLSTILSAVFPSADAAEIDRRVWLRVKQSRLGKRKDKPKLKQERKEQSVLDTVDQINTT